MKYIFGIVLIVLSMISMATSAGWHEVGKVTKVHTGHGTNGIIYFASETQVSIEGCSTNDRGTL